MHRRLRCTRLALSSLHCRCRTALPLSPGTTRCSSTSSATPDRSTRPSSRSWCCSRSRRGRSSSTRPGRTAALEQPDATFPRRLPAEQQVLRGAGRLPVAARQPARRRVPGRLRRDQRAVPAHGARARPDQSAGAAPDVQCSRASTAVDRALLRAAAVEVNKLEQRVTFLATTASVAPFIGLFGTVWGIMIAFKRIGATGSTNLAVVGPGHLRSADRDGGRAVRGHSGGVLLQPLHARR